MQMDLRHHQIGIDRLVRLKWLDRTVALALAGNDAATIKSSLQETLKDSFQSANPNVRGSLDKTITVLLKVWLNTPPSLSTLRLSGLSLLGSQPRENHLAIHWGMVMSVYPFWASVSTHVGRLLTLQSSVGASQVQRRVREQYGERETVSRRARYVMRSFLDWGVLDESGSKGVYIQGISMGISDPQLVSWLIEASLRARDSGSAMLGDLLKSPDLFPFQLAPITAKNLLSASPRLESLHQSLDGDVVMIRRQKV